MAKHVARRGRIRAVLALGSVLGIGAVATGAYWTDQASITGITISSGTLDLKVNGQDNITGYTGLGIANMVPGNTVAAVLTVKNNGTVPFTYTATSTATNPDGKNLAGALTVKLTGASTVTGTSPAATCSGATLTGTGTSLNGSLVSTARSLAAGASETLCIQVTLPTAADNAVQSASTSATLTFNATQVAP